MSKKKMWNTTVKVKTPATFDASHYPLTFTEQTVNARYTRKQKEIVDDAGKTVQAEALIMIDVVDTVDVAVDLTTDKVIEYNSADLNVLKLEGVWDDSFDARDHWEIWIT